MDLALDNLQMLIYPENQATNQATKQANKQTNEQNASYIYSFVFLLFYTSLFHSLFLFLNPSWFHSIHNKPKFSKFSSLNQMYET